MAVGNPKSTEKKSFVLYADHNELWENLSNEQAGKLIKHTYKYVIGVNPEPPDEITGLLFFQIKATLDRDQKKWEAVREARSESGKKGGRPLKAKKPNAFKVKLTDAYKANGFKKKETKANEAVSVNDNVNDNELVEDEFYDIDTLQLKYLAHDDLVIAVKEKEDFTSGVSLESRLKEFNKFLKAKAQFTKTWKDYTSHFLSWLAKSPRPHQSETPTFNSPVI